MLIAAVLVSCAGMCAAQDASQPQSVVGSKVAPLNVLTLDGQTYDIAANKGWRVIYFFSAVCKCVRRCERLSYLPLAAKYSGRVSFYAVDADWFDLQETPAQFKRAVASHNLPYPVFLDSRGRLAAALDATTTPQAFLISPSGRVVFAGMPDDSSVYNFRTGKEGLTRCYLADALAQALAGKTVVQPTIQSFGCAICPSAPN